LNTAVPQAYYNKVEGIKRLATETGAGQWGVALSQACSFFSMECTVYMVKVSYFQKPYRRSLMHIFGSNVIPSPSPMTNSGRQILENDPESMGSLGMAISEAVEDAAGREDTNYALGSVLNHVVLLRRRQQLRRDSLSLCPRQGRTRQKGSAAGGGAHLLPDPYPGPLRL